MVLRWLAGQVRSATRSTLQVFQQVYLSQEVLKAKVAAGRALTIMSLLVVDHIAKFGRLDGAEHALENLVGATS